MTLSKSDLLLHPIRLRIMTAIVNQRMTASDLAKILPDIPQATLYRHINALVEGGMLLIVAENPVRGTVERVYGASAPPSLTAADLRGMNKQDYINLFSQYLSFLMADAQRYLASKPDKGELDILADGVTLSKAQFLLSDDEFSEMNKKIIELMIAASKNQPADNRRRRIFTYLFLPSNG